MAMADDCAVMVRIQGRDPVGAHAFRHAFYRERNGRVALSCSGVLFSAAQLRPFLSAHLVNHSQSDKNNTHNIDIHDTMNDRMTHLDDRAVYVLCNGLMLEPFVSLVTPDRHVSRDPSGHGTHHQVRQPALATGTRVDVLHRSLDSTHASAAMSTYSASVVHIGEVPAAQAATRRLIGGSSLWQVGHAMAKDRFASVMLSSKSSVVSSASSPSASSSPVSRPPTAIGSHINGLRRSPALTAVLRVERPSTALRSAVRRGGARWLAPSDQALPRGAQLRIVASPYGLLSPTVFYNCVSVGVLSNVVMPSESDRRGSDAGDAVEQPGLLLTDARCQAGSEGGAVLDAHSGALVGLLTVPVTHRVSSSSTVISSVEMNVALPIGAVAHWLCDVVFRGGGGDSASGGMDNVARRPPVNEAIQRAERAVVAVKVGSTWASAIVVSGSGFLITNAHVVPATNTSAQRVLVRLQAHHLDALTCWEPQRTSAIQHGDTHLTHQQFDTTSLRRHWQASFPGGRWISASVDWASPGPWDVAVLRLDTRMLHDVLRQCLLLPQSMRIDHSRLLHAVRVPLDRIRPGSGTTAHQHDMVAWTGPIRRGMPVAVMGHGLFPPRIGLQPILSYGVLANVAYATLDPRALARSSRRSDPILYLTTALVHGGNSGGMLLEAGSGALLGLVTSNLKQIHSDADPARQSSGDDVYRGKQIIVPSLNFAVPWQVLLPVLRYCREPCEASRAIMIEQMCSMNMRTPVDQARRVWALQDSVEDLPDPEETQRRLMNTPGQRRVRELVEQMNSQHRHQEPHQAQVSPTLSFPVISSRL